MSVFVIGAALTHRRFRRSTQGDPISFVRKELKLSVRRYREFQALALLCIASIGGAVVALIVVVLIELTAIRKFKRALSRLT